MRGKIGRVFERVDDDDEERRENEQHEHREPKQDRVGCPASAIGRQPTRTAAGRRVPVPRDERRPLRRCRHFPPARSSAVCNRRKTVATMVMMTTMTVEIAEPYPTLASSKNSLYEK